MAAWVRQDAIPSYICVNPCYLWETFLCKKLLCVPWVLWEYSSPTDCTDQHRWLVAWVRQGCHTLLHLCKSVLSVGDPSLQEASVQICEICGRKSQQEGSVNSVKSVGGNRSKKVRVKSVGELFWLRGVYPPTEQTGRGCSPTDCTDQHRWLVALVGAWVRQDAIPSYKTSVRSVGSVGVPLLAWLVQQRELHPLRLHQCHLWKSLLSKKFLCVLWVLWEAISRMWVRGYGRMPYPPIRWGARCPVSSDRCRARRCRSCPRYNR